MRSVFIIGGAGFLGRSVIRDLIKHENVNITVFDQTKPAIDVPYIKGSILDYDGLLEAMKGHDTVMHMAAMLGVENCQKRPGEVIRTNLTGTAKVLRAARECGVKKFLFTSSSEVYGNGDGKSLFHEDDVLRPRSLYARTKAMGEAAVRKAAQDHGISCTVVRYFNVYGPEQRDDFVVSTFVDRSLTGQPLIVHGDGTQVRTFTFVEDAARGTVCGLKYQYDQPGTYETFNIGSTETSSIQDLAELVSRLTGNSSEIVRKDFTNPQVRRLPEYEIYRRIPSVERAREKLDFQAQTTLEMGLNRVLDARATKFRVRQGTAA